MTQRDAVTEALLVLDVITTFEHDDGDQLLESMRGCVPALVRALAHARGCLPVIYVNDAAGNWDGDAPAHIARALWAKGSLVLHDVMPQSGDLVLFKADYSAFAGTALADVLGESGVNRIVLTGAVTEMCVAQTAIAARASGYQVTVLRDACATIDQRNEEISLAYLEHVTGSFIRSTHEWIVRR
jgi:nicotinamidase-related amidase